MAESHAHHHHHHHHVGTDPDDFGRAFAVGIVLNLGFVAVEATAGLIGNSMALLADAGHNLSDVLGLAMAWAAWWLSKRVPTSRFTYGLQSSTILAALANAVLLLVACGGIAWESFRRLVDPSPPIGEAMMLVAGLGIVINALTAVMFARGRKGDLNIRGAFVHMVADALVSAGVVIAGLLVIVTGKAWIDPLASLIVVAVILIGTISLLRNAMSLALNAVPHAIDPQAVAQRLAALDGVEAVHHLHIWPISTTASALTAHLVVPSASPCDALLAQANRVMIDEFGIAHVTLQIETRMGCPDSEGAPCRA